MSENSTNSWKLELRHEADENNGIKCRRETPHLVVVFATVTDLCVMKVCIFN